MTHVAALGALLSLQTLALAPAPLAAQQSATGPASPVVVDQYVTLRGADTIATERVERDGRALRSVLVRRQERLQLTLRPHRATDELVDSLAIEAQFVGTDAVLQRALVRIVGDTALLSVSQSGGAPQLQRIPTRAGAVPFVNLAMPMYEQLVRRALVLGLAGTAPVSVPVFLAEGAQTATATLRRGNADTVVLTLGVEMRMAIAPDGRLLGAVVPSQGLCIVRAPGSCTVAAPPPAADYSAPAGAPYDAIPVTLLGSGDTRLAGTFTLPRERGATGRVPAVLLLSGSGAQDRDEAIPGVPGYRPFRQIADTLARRGIAVLRLDDRGIGGSALGAEPGSLEVLARDAARAVAWLRSRDEVRADRVAIVGHSEGGIVGPIVAASDSAMRALVLVAAPARRGRDVSDYQIGRAVAQQPSIAPAVRDSAVRAAIATRDAVVAADPALAAFLDHDPAPVLRRVRMPVLIVQGETDLQVTADQAPELEAHLRAGGNRAVTVRVLPRTNHLLLDDPVGEPSGYAALPSKAVSAAILGLITEWLVTRMR